MEVEAQDILPVEIWTRILYLLPNHNWRLLQNVCSLFWNIVQHFVALGLIKSDFYVSTMYILQNLRNMYLSF